MNKTITSFEVSSPDELREALAVHESNGPCFAAVRVFGRDVLTRQFNFPNSFTQDLIAGLKLEALETLSAALDVEVSYQITDVDEEGIHGIFSAVPRHLLMEYLEVFKSQPLIPVSLTASAVAAVIDFLKTKPMTGDNFCLVNFLKSHAVNIIIFTNARPAFFRELYDLSDSDYKDKITDTIRYSCSQSASKSIDHVLFTGDITGKEALIKSLKELENSSPDMSLPREEKPLDLTGLNLFGKLVCGLAEREKLVFIFSLVFVASVLWGIFLVWHFSDGYSKLHDAAIKVDMSDYNRALDLKEQIKRLSHA